MYRLLTVAILASAAFAQPAFEVASIKHDPFAGQGAVGIHVAGNRFIAEHQSLSGLVMFAYGVEEYQVSGGPAWIYSRDLYGSDVYAVNAKAEGDSAPGKEQFQQMLQALLADRFQLKVHRETRDLPAYELTIAKGGAKMKEAMEDPAAHTIWRSGQPERYSGKKVPMSELAFVLRTQTGRPVIDKTGLMGKYDFELRWASGNPPPADAADPSIFTAVQEQLGLKLEAAKAPFETIMIDSAAKPSGD